MKISQVLGLAVTGHRDIPFVDIDDREDTKLFLDPYVIQALHDDFCHEANICIQSFFEEVFDACGKNDRKRVAELLSHASEPNETNLGMKEKSDRGKGSGPRELMSKFMRFYRDVAGGHHTHWTVCLYMENFDKDKMSDLITNIIRRLLYLFTLQQCHHWSIPVSQDVEPLGYYWCPDEKEWKELNGYALNIRGAHRLLVPKHVVRANYLCKTDRYIRQYILRAVQQQHLDQRSDKCTTVVKSNGEEILKPPTRKELYRSDVQGKNHKKYASLMGHNNGVGEQQFVDDTLEKIREGVGALTDVDLDNLVYGIENESA